MLADTSDIHAFSTAQRGHADDLASVAAGLTAARVAADAFGSVGAGFVFAINEALVDEARRVTQLAERVRAAGTTSAAAADAYGAAESHAGQTISSLDG